MTNQANVLLHFTSAIIEKSAGETESIAFDGRTFIEYHNAVTKR